MRQCFLHVGTHKTATTSLQHFLSTSPQELAERGWFYPRTGRPAEASTGHHNLAWEISGDRRFRPENGGREALIGEIAETDRNIIISSEDFECSAHHSERFEEFIAAIRKLGLRVNLVVYLRNQIDYAESLYCTMVEFGFNKPFFAFADEIMEAGTLQWREWIFPFRYHDFIAQLASFTDVEVIVRSYDWPTMGSPILDFLSIVGLGDPLPPAEQLPRHNQRSNLRVTVQRYVASQAEQPLNDAEIAAIDAFTSQYRAACPTMSLTRQIRFAEAFDKSNRAVCERYLLPRFKRMQRQELAASASPSLEDIFGPYFFGFDFGATARTISHPPQTSEDAGGR